MDRSLGQIRFGSGSLIYLGVVTLLTTTAFYTQANLLFWALGLVVGGLVVSLALSMIMLRGIEVQRMAPTRGTADEPLVLRYLVTNRSKLSWFGIEVLETWPSDRRGRVGPIDATNTPMLLGRPHGWLLHIGPGQTIQAEAVCWPRRRGLLDFGCIHLRTGFPFGIVRKQYIYKQSSHVLIHPPQRRLNRQTVLSLSSQDVSGGRHSNRSGGQEEFFGLRPYRPGDSFKLIDWKHSARAANLVSREMAGSRPPRMMILLDVAPPPNHDPAVAHHDTNPWRLAQEQAITLAAALVREAFLHDVHVGLSVRGAACPLIQMRHNQAHHQRLLDSLAAMDLDVTGHDAPPSVRPTVIVLPQITHEDPNQHAPRPSAVIHSAYGRHTDSLFTDINDPHTPNRQTVTAEMN